MPRLSKIGAAALGAFGWTATAAAAPQTSDPYYPYVTMLLPGNGTNGAQNNTFLDSSTNNYSLTRNGNTTQGTISPFGSNWSNYFDGSTSYLSLGTNSAYTFSSGSWTYEGYIYLTMTLIVVKELNFLEVPLLQKLDLVGLIVAVISLLMLLTQLKGINFMLMVTQLLILLYKLMVHLTLLV